MEPGHAEEIAREYEARLDAVRDLAERLRARVEEVLARFPEAAPPGDVPPTDTEQPDG